MFWLGQKKFGKRIQKSEKTAFLTSQKKLKSQSGSYGCTKTVLLKFNFQVRELVFQLIPLKLYSTPWLNSYFQFTTEKFADFKHNFRFFNHSVVEVT